MIPNINPRQMDQMMKKMGIKQIDIDAEEVIIKCKDKKIIISNPSVQKVDMMGQKSFQISGEESEEELEEHSEDDIQTVINQANCTEEEAKQALKDTEGNIAEAILLLTAEKE
ncbi:TPA: nascent polypeptide-associated complex protein [Candidatus Woesearchaeota archaeon]|nr:nascent polypeptide-associated complex protein [Candidatus Woesearchaeota archaeon]HIH32567.1 nascent polypeptide-associated complex protein [Candidatus Woesearchaeota archaeon]HIH54802.1 nascent polypeptide-associated complex protein [Candidatus Woesearchaeota archaeon]HIJ02154.1 nascent polypeptide-associated complex protein [Candidatus Woesearchaeota archaeon]HIJ13640.1 nascent polypeptide-associated complex protein [Candidatus Woesearchaeota archaeon]